MFSTDLIACSLVPGEAANLVPVYYNIGNYSLYFIFVSALIHGVLFFRQKIEIWHFLIAAACPFVIFVAPVNCLYVEYAITASGAAIVSLFMLVHACFLIYSERKEGRNGSERLKQKVDLSESSEVT